MQEKTPSCRWIHKSSAVHTDTLCDHMFHALLILLTLYCSAHLLMCLTHNDKSTDTHLMFHALQAPNVRGGPASIISVESGLVEIVVCLWGWCHSWCRETAATFLALTSSLSHIHMFTCSCRHAHCPQLKQKNICFNWGKPRSNPPPPMSVAGSGIPS